MSAALVMDNCATQTFVDDLESVLYVILWLVLMYFPSSMMVEQLTAFVHGILDPKQYSGMGGTTKADFLKGHTTLQGITFPNWPLLPALLLELVSLFAVRYKTLPIYTPVMLVAFQIHYQQRMKQLESHDHVIKLISDAIRDPQMWPTNDAAIQQSLVVPKEVKKKRTKTMYGLEQSERQIKKLWLDPTDSE